MPAKRRIILLVWGALALALAFLALAPGAWATPTQSALRRTIPGQAVLKVWPGDDCQFKTIQEAVDTAYDGDIIKVAAGTYTGVSARPRNDITTTGVVTQVVYVSKGLTIRGGYTTTNWVTSDPEANPTTLNAQGQGRVLYVTGDITVTVEGLRITGGDATGLGGGASGGDAGGGAYVVNATATIIDCRLSGSSSKGGAGGGLYLRDCDARLVGNTVRGNDAAEAGALFVDGGTITLSGNAVISNTADTWAGLCISDVDVATLTSNLVSDNTGGGLSVAATCATLMGNTVARNSGMGLRLDGDDARLTNNIIADNVGGMTIHGPLARLVHNTVAHNGGEQASGIVVANSHGPAAVALTNTILVSHTVGISVGVGCTATLESTLWQGNATDWTGPGAIIHNNDYTGDPAFVDPEGGDYHLGPGSAALDRGVDAHVIPDIDFQPRPYQTPDLGADEYWPPGALKVLRFLLVMRHYSYQW